MTHQDTDIIWIDDDPDRITHDPLINSSISLNGRDVQQALSDDLLGRAEPDLIIVDHFLTATDDAPENITAQATGLFTYGSMVAEAIRAQWAKCPVIGVSSSHLNERIARSGTSAESSYLTMMDYASIPERLGEIRTISLDFKQITTINFTDDWKSEFVALFNVNPEWKIDEFLCDCSPFDFLGNQDKSLPHRIGSWIINSFISRPGFLINRRYLAAYLGLKEDSVDKVSHLFSAAQYHGIFSGGREPLWWSSALRRELISIDTNFEILGSQDAGRQLPDIVEDDYSRSPSGVLANILAYTDGNLEDLVDAHIDETEVIDSAVELGFEPTRVIIGG